MTDPLARRADAIQAVCAALASDGKLHDVAAGQVDALATYVFELVTAELGRLDVRRMRFEAATAAMQGLLRAGEEWTNNIDNVADWATGQADALLKRLGYEVPGDG